MAIRNARQFKNALKQAKIEVEFSVTPNHVPTPSINKGTLQTSPFTNADTGTMELFRTQRDSSITEGEDFRNPL